MDGRALARQMQCGLLQKLMPAAGRPAVLHQGCLQRGCDGQQGSFLKGGPHELHSNWHPCSTQVHWAAAWPLPACVNGCAPEHASWALQAFCCDEHGSAGRLPCHACSHSACEQLTCRHAASPWQQHSFLRMQQHGVCAAVRWAGDRNAASTGHTSSVVASGHGDRRQAQQVGVRGVAHEVRRAGQVRHAALQRCRPAGRAGLGCASQGRVLQLRHPQAETDLASLARRHACALWGKACNVCRTCCCCRRTVFAASHSTLCSCARQQARGAHNPGRSDGGRRGEHNLAGFKRALPDAHHARPAARAVQLCAVSQCPVCPVPSAQAWQTHRLIWPSPQASMDAGRPLTLLAKVCSPTRWPGLGMHALCKAPLQSEKAGGPGPRSWTPPSCEQAGRA